MLCCKLNRTRAGLSAFLMLFYFLLIAIGYVNGAPFLDSGLPIQSEIVDPSNRTIWAMFNLTDAQLNRVKAQINAKKQADELQGEANFENIKEFRINNIRQRLESALNVGSSEESQDHPQHEMAAYPICSSDSNEATWQQDNNVTIRFSDSLFERNQANLNLDSAILRLYKYNANRTEEANANNSAEESNGEDDNNKAPRCADLLPDAQIRVTVSIVQQLRRNKRERRKRICNTLMMNVSKTGWVEIDIKRAIRIWENGLQPQSQRNQVVLVGWLMIEVHDEEERPLKPGKYFLPPKCDQADFAVPWNFYYGQNTALSTLKANEVPRYPRIDVKLIGYAAFAPKANDINLHEKLRENLRRQLSVESSSNSNSEIDNETTLPTSSSFSSLLSTPTLASAAVSPSHIQQPQQQQLPHHSKMDHELEPKIDRDSSEHIRHHRRVSSHNGQQQHHRHHSRNHNHHRHHHHHHHQHQYKQQSHEHQQHLEY